MAEHQYIQLPPDSTGKKLMHRVAVILQYQNGTIAFAIGDKIVGATSTASGDVTYVEGTVNSGELHIGMDIQSVVAFTSGEDLEVSSVKKAEANGVGVAQYIAMSVITSGETAEHTAKVDNHGSLHMRFQDGDPALDITGRQEVVNPISIADYTFKYDEDAGGQIDLVTDGTASTTYMSDQNAVRMRVNNSTGDLVSAQTHAYHIVPEGIAFGAIFTLWVGDGGKANCRRRWGLFDADDGNFFEVNGTTVNVVQRSSATGSLVETRVAQENWNLDVMDGSSNDDNPSGVSLDVSKTNIYYLESAGNGGMKLGVFLGGDRFPVHAFVHAGYFSGVAIGQNAQMPFRAELENTGTTASTSEMYLISATVLANTTAEALYNAKEGVASLYTEAVSVDSDWTHMFSIRAAQLYKGKNNRAWMFPILNTFISDTANIVVSMRVGSTVEDGSWVQNGIAEYNIDSTSASGGVSMMYGMGGANEVVHVDPLDNKNSHELKFHRNAIISEEPPTLTVFCKSLGASTNVTMTFTWMELL